MGLLAAIRRHPTRDRRGGRRAPERGRAAARRTCRRPTRGRRTSRSRDCRSGLGEARRRPASRKASTVPRRHPRRDRASRLRPCARRRRSDARRARPPQPARHLCTDRTCPPRTETRRRARSRRARNTKRASQTAHPRRPLAPRALASRARDRTQVRGDSLEAVLRRRVPIAQRDPAAASQQAFERTSAKAGITQPPPGPRATGHIDAARIAATVNGAAITTEAAAHAFDLRFLALEDHTVELWLAERWLDHPAAPTRSETSSPRPRSPNASPSSPATTSPDAAPSSQPPSSANDNADRSCNRRADHGSQLPAAAS